MSKYTKGPWFVSGVRFRMNGSEWVSVNRYNEAKKQDDNIACIGYDPRTGDGQADAHLIAAAPELLEALDNVVAAADLPGDHCEMEQAVRVARTILAKFEASE